MARTFILIATIYLVLGGCLGFFMGSTQNFTLAPVHAHVLLAGWVSLAVMGLIYQQFPSSSATRLASIHLWLHNIALPTFMVGLALELTGRPVPLILPLGATGFLLALIIFAANIWLSIGRQKTAG